MKDNKENNPDSSPNTGPGTSTGMAAGEDNPISSGELRAISAEIPDHLPAEQQMETKVVLLDVDPYHVHVYWHIQAADLAAARDAVGRARPEATLVLRLHDALCQSMTGFIPWPPLELEVDGLNGYRHVEVPDPGKTLVAELGLRGPGAAFTSLASSGLVRLPPSNPAESAVPDRIDLVLIDKPGRPPRVVEVLSVPADQSAMGSPSGGPDAAYLPPSHGLLEQDSSQVLAEASPASFGAEQWPWSGSPVGGFSDRENNPK